MPQKTFRFPKILSCSSNNNSQRHVFASYAYTKAKLTWENGEKLIEAQLAFFNTNLIKKFKTNEFAIFATMVILLNLYFLSNFSISIDDETLAFTSSYQWWLSIGRWTTAFIDYFIFPQPIAPYTPYLFFSVCLALGYMFLIQAHNISSSFQKYFALPVFVTYPVWQFITGFDATLPAISVGIVLVTFSCLLFACTRKIWSKAIYTTPAISLGLQIALIATATGAYQSFILMYLAICFGIMLTGVIQDRDTFQTVLQSGIQLAIVIVLGLLLYYVVANFAQQITHTEPANYLEGYNDIRKLFNHPLRVLRAVALKVYAYYSGDINKFGAALPASGLVTILSFLFIIAQTWHENYSRKLLGIILWFAVFISPFLLYLVSSNIPARSLFSLAYVMWFISILLLAEKRKIFLAVKATLVFFLILQSLNINGLYSARAFIAQEYDRALAADLYSQLGYVDEKFERAQPIIIDVYGAINFSSIYPSPWGETIGVSFFDWDGGNVNRMVAYMKLMGYSNLNTLPAEQRLQLTPYFEGMPAWPATGYVKKINDIYLIKLSDSPDGVHSQFSPTP